MNNEAKQWVTKELLEVKKLNDRIERLENDRDWILENLITIYGKPEIDEIYASI